MRFGGTRWLIFRTQSSVSVSSVLHWIQDSQMCALHRGLRTASQERQQICKSLWRLGMNFFKCLWLERLGWNLRRLKTNGGGTLKRAINGSLWAAKYSKDIRIFESLWKRVRRMWHETHWIDWINAVSKTCRFGQSLRNGMVLVIALWADPGELLGFDSAMWRTCFDLFSIDTAGGNMNWQLGISYFLQHFDISIDTSPSTGSIWFASNRIPSNSYFAEAGLLWCEQDHLRLSLPYFMHSSESKETWHDPPAIMFFCWAMIICLRNIQHGSEAQNMLSSVMSYGRRPPISKVKVSGFGPTRQSRQQCPRPTALSQCWGQFGAPRNVAWTSRLLSRLCIWSCKSFFKLTRAMNFFNFQFWHSKSFRKSRNDICRLRQHPSTRRMFLGLWKNHIFFLPSLFALSLVVSWTCMMHFSRKPFFWDCLWLERHPFAHQAAGKALYKSCGVWPPMLLSGAVQLQRMPDQGCALWLCQPVTHVTWRFRDLWQWRSDVRVFSGVPYGFTVSNIKAGSQKSKLQTPLKLRSLYRWSTQHLHQQKNQSRHLEGCIRLTNR